MNRVPQLIEAAFAKLAKQPGFVDRPNQRQLALLLGDLMAEANTGAFEAPTGLGKSLACLIPAIAAAKALEKRIVIATYTNVLAEQYWRKDLPFALSLFEGAAPKTALLMGRARYACLVALHEQDPAAARLFQATAEMGIESEWRGASGLNAKAASALWPKVTAPPVCPSRQCPSYDACYYFRARRQAERAGVVITNHSVVVQDALIAHAVDGDGMLGAFDFLVLDEAHDFPQAAANGMEFEISSARLSMLGAIVGRLDQTLRARAAACEDLDAWLRDHDRFRVALEGLQRELSTFGLSHPDPGILVVSPAEIAEHPQITAARAPRADHAAREFATKVAKLCDAYAERVDRALVRWADRDPEGHASAAESINMYLMFVREFAIGARTLFAPQGVAVSHTGRNGLEPRLRRDVVGLAEPLREMVWERTPWACLSATMALDGTFDFFRRTTGAQPQFEEVLPTPFDFGTQAAVYLPPDGTIPDPTLARREGMEDAYHRAVARELSQILVACGGRTLALFHSRREMEGVLMYMDVPPDLPILVQGRSGAGSVGERFRKNVRASLFALRSFWTGFDAPGETLSCVVLVRVPFEVPIDPPQIARMAWLQSQGRDPFFEHTLPNAKMLMRQGAGRLIRSDEDRGLIALLDPRLLTKRYGEEILGNLPPEMRRFRDLLDAVGWLGLGDASPAAP